MIHVHVRKMESIQEYVHVNALPQQGSVTCMYMYMHVYTCTCMIDMVVFIQA